VRSPGNYWPSLLSLWAVALCHRINWPLKWVELPHCGSSGGRPDGKVDISARHTLGWRDGKPDLSGVWTS